MDTMTFFDFDLAYAFINGAFALLGFIGWEVWQFKKNETEYLKEEKRGDYIFGLFVIPLVFTFGIPYLWDYLDKDTFYNPLTSMTGGFLFDFLVLGLINKAKKKTEE